MIINEKCKKAINTIIKENQLTEVSSLNINKYGYLLFYSDICFQFYCGNPIENKTLIM